VRKSEEKEITEGEECVYGKRKRDRENRETVLDLVIDNYN